MSVDLIWQYFSIIKQKMEFLKENPSKNIVYTIGGRLIDDHMCCISLFSVAAWDGQNVCHHP